MKKLAVLLVLFSCMSVAYAQKKDIAKTPPMGWNSWNYFNCDINETVVREMADAMVLSGMAAVGYEYVIIDDCWQINRLPDGTLVADPVKFPSGIKALADYIHSKGLKFGIYSDAGKKTCEERPGSLNYEEIDAKTFNKWGVDYVKYDWCHHGLLKASEVYPIMGGFLNNTDREIVYSVCNWGWGKPWEWAPDFAHLWRTTWDIEPCFDCRGKLIHKNVEEIIDLNASLAQYAKPGAWNDPDMLEVGNGTLTNDENIAHFSLWCMMAAPLIAGNDLRNMDKEVLQILTNKDMLLINQDALGVQGYRVYENLDFEIWLKPLENGAKAFCFFNRGNEIMNYNIDWKSLVPLLELYEVFNVWESQLINDPASQNKIILDSNSVKVFRLDLKP
jgi:alpha-galactosidase